VSWQEIDAVAVSGRGRALRRLFCYSATCHVRISLGDTLRVSRFTRDGRPLAETIDNHAWQEPIPPAR
jgi:hypothetical protein